MRLASVGARRVSSATLAQRGFFGGAHKSDHHDAHHDEHHAEQPAFPKGYLFGEKPAADGGKRKREDWELIWYWGMGGSFLLGLVGLASRPDTKPSAWARQEMLERSAAKKE